MVSVHVTADSSVPREKVLEAARDFSDRRAEIWPMVQSKYLQVHETGDTFADVTEGTFVVGRFWERSRYDWSERGAVKATVTDSNVFKPGSTWELRAAPQNGGTAVKMTLNRDFQSGFRGRIAGAVNHGFGDRWRRFGWGRMLQQVLAGDREAKRLRGKAVSTRCCSSRAPSSAAVEAGHGLPALLAERAGGGLRADATVALHGRAPARLEATPVLERATESSKRYETLRRLFRAGST